MADFQDKQTNSGSGGAYLPTIDVANPTTGHTDSFPVGALAFASGSADVTGAMQGVDSTHGLPTQIVSALPAGANSIGTVVLGAGSSVIGHVILDSGSVVATLNGTSAVSLADGANTTFGAEADAAAASDTAAATYMGLFKRLLQRITTLLSQLPAALTGGGNLKAAIVESTATVSVAGTFWQATQPISAAALPLPAGAATDVTLSAASAKLPATLGQHAMAASMSIVVASDQTAIPVSGTVAATQSGTWTVQPGNSANTTPWLVEIGDGVHVMPTGDASARTIHVTLDNASIVVTGTFWQATQPVSLATLPALAAGANVIGHVIVDAGTAVIGHVINDAGTAVIGGMVPSSAAGAAPVGATPFSVVSAANTTPIQIKGTGGTSSAGTLWDCIAVNVGTAPIYARFFDKAASPTMGTDTPVYVLPLPSQGTANGGGAARAFPVGVKFANGIWVSFTAGIALLDNTAGAASQVALSGSYN